MCIRDSLCIVLKGFQDGARLALEHALRGVQLEDPVHLLGRDDDLVVQRDRATNKARVATLRNNCDSTTVAVFQTCGNLLRSCRRQHDRADADVFLRKVHHKWRQLVGILNEVLRAYYIRERLQISRGECGKLLARLLGIYRLGNGSANRGKFVHFRRFKATLNGGVERLRLHRRQRLWDGCLLRLCCLGRLLQVT